MTREAEITVNGVRLTPTQAMTIRVAISSFDYHLEGGLGDDADGRRMVRIYQANIAQLFRLLDRIHP